MIKIDREPWLLYVKENHGKIPNDAIADHIGIAKRTLGKWIKEWRACGALPPSTIPVIDWDIHKQYILDNNDAMEWKEMADKLGINYHTFHNTVSTWGIRPKGRGIRDRWKEWVVANKKNYTVKEIADHCGVAQPTMESWIKGWYRDGTLERKSNAEHYRDYILENKDILTTEQMGKYMGVDRTTAGIWVRKITGQRKKRIDNGPYSRVPEGQNKTWKKLDPVEKARRQEERRLIAQENKDRKERQKEIERIKAAKERTIRKMAQSLSPVKKDVLPTRKVDESQYKNVRIDAKTIIRVKQDIPDHIAINKWIEKYKKAV